MSFCPYIDCHAGALMVLKLFIAAQVLSVSSIIVGTQSRSCSLAAKSQVSYQHACTLVSVWSEWGYTSVADPEENAFLSIAFISVSFGNSFVCICLKKEFCLKNWTLMDLVFKQ